MEISIEMLLTEFRKTNFESIIHCPDRTKAVRNIRLFSGTETEYEKNCLYVINDTDDSENSLCNHTANFPNGKEYTCLFIVSSSKEQNLFPFEIRTGLAFADVYNHLQDCFFRFEQWHNRLSLAVLSEAPFQEFIDISEDIIRSPMLLFDPSLKLMAHTKKQTAATDDLYQQCISSGYLEYEAFQYFSKDHLLDELEEKGVKKENI